MAYLTLFLPKISGKFTEKIPTFGEGGSSRLGQIPNFYRKFVLEAPLRWAASFESVARCRRNYNQNHRIHPHHHNELQKRLRSVWRWYPFHPALSVSPNCVFMALWCFKVSRRKISISFSDSLNWEDISFVVIMNDCCDTDAGIMKISYTCALNDIKSSLRSLTIRAKEWSCSKC